MTTPSATTLDVRQATPGDAPACGRICYEAFGAISIAHNFPTDFPTPEDAAGMLGAVFAEPGFHCLVALRRDGSSAASVWTSVPRWSAWGPSPSNPGPRTPGPDAS